MSLFTRLSALCQVLEKQATLPVRISRPDNAPGLYVWPWRIEEDTRVRSSRLPGETMAMHAPPPLIHFLLMANTALDSDTLSALETARLALLDTPVFEAGDGRVSVSPAAMSAGELSSLFTAADIPLRLSLAYTLRSTA
ncbi:MAG: DUF4255 domain-containing protein [Azonexaceae bacterium]|nr:DUF4255 domain-containing protein [Azonexaceae bacterium]